MDLLKSERPWTTGQDALLPEEVPRLLAACKTLEEEALLRLAISTGIRREDIVAIRMEGVDLVTGTLTYYETKKRRTRTLPLGGECLQRLRQWTALQERGAKWLFPSARSKTGHISGRHAYNLFHGVLTRAGLELRPFHALRATCVKLAQARKWTPEQVAELTGDTLRVIQQHYSTPSRAEMAKVAREQALV